MLPNFIIAGAAKSGSTTLYHYLSAHPDVFLSEDKEPAFFSNFWHKGLDWYGTCFAGHSGQTAVGEATVQYMVEPDVPARIARVIPGVKLIFILRDPVPRAWSHYWHRVKLGAERRSFEEILKSKDPGEYPVLYGLYATHLGRYFDHFPASQLKILILEETKADFQMTLRSVLEFLPVNPDIPIAYDGPRNKARIPRFPSLNRLAAKIALKEKTKESLPASAALAIQKALRLTNRLNMQDFSYPPLKPEHAQHLQGVFRLEIERLEKMLGRDIPSWRRQSHS